MGGGDEFERIEEIKATNASYILPINFPDAYDIEDVYSANILQLSDMREWNQRPSNLSQFEENGIQFAITMYGLKSPNNLKTNIKKAIDNGLSKSKALEALTSAPAKIIGRDDVLGYLKKGYLANFLITSGEIFDSKTIIHENWVKGNRNIIKSMNVKDIRGKYNLTINEKSAILNINGEIDKPKAKLNDSTLSVKKLTYKKDWINMTINDESNLIRLSLRSNLENNDLEGKIYYSNGIVNNISAQFFENQESKSREPNTRNNKEKNILPVKYPNMAYGFNEPQKSEDILIKNATIWTNENQGI